MRADTPLARGLQRTLIGLAVLGVAIGARADDLPEYRLKAAFLFNFASFTEWPAEVPATLNLCLYGGDAFGAEIEPLAGKKVGERSIELHRRSPLESLKGCQIVFVSSTAIGQLPRVLEALRGLPVLTVADAPGAVQQGAALNMRVAQGRITFEANLATVRAARLTLSSKLLRLATEVVQ